VLFSGVVGTLLPVLFLGVSLGFVTIWVAFPTQAKNQKIEDFSDIAIDASVTKTSISIG